MERGRDGQHNLLKVPTSYKESSAQLQMVSSMYEKTLEQLKAPHLSELCEQSQLDQNQTIGNPNESQQHDTDQNQE